MAYSHQDFIAAVLGEFPELRDAFAGCHGALDLEVGELAVFTQAAKVRGDLATYGRCLKTVDALFAEADADLAGALRLAYLEHLEFEGSRGPAAWQLVPPRIQSAWQQVAAENRRLMALPQKSALKHTPARTQTHSPKHTPKQPKQKPHKGKSNRDNPRRGRHR